MKIIFRKFAIAFVVIGTLTGLAPQAFAQMPQTDIAFIAQMKGTDADKLDALAVYYDLHISDLVVQLLAEQSTGAFLGARWAERDGKVAEQKRLTKMYDAARIELDKERQINRDIRSELSQMSGIEFPTDLVMAPHAPEMLTPAPSGAPEDLINSRNKAWKQVELASAAWTAARMQLLTDQEDYNMGKKGVRIGDSMRSVTRAEIDIARAAGAFRMIEARIAVAIGKPLAAVLGAL